MAIRRVHVERLLSKRVRDPAGRPVGRIEEVKAEVLPDGRCVVTEFLLGSRALWSRLDITSFALSILNALGADKYPATHRVPWDQLDLSDPDHPRLRHPADQLQAIEPAHALKRESPRKNPRASRE